MAAAATLYAPLAGDTSANVFYVSGATASPTAPFSLPYVSPAYPQQFGPVNLPRVYALNLDTLEVGSSGRIALTLNDVHALDIVRTNASALTTFRGVSGESLALSTGVAAVGVTSAGTVTVDAGGARALDVSSTRVVVTPPVAASDLALSGILTATGPSSGSNGLRVSNAIVTVGVGAANDAAVGAAGLVVGSLPSGVVAGTTEASAASKSLLWHAGTGTIPGQASSDLTDTGRTQEPFWELRGGPLRLAQHASSGGDVAYEFRIGAGGALEIVQVWDSATLGTKVFRRVARFGTTAML